MDKRHMLLLELKVDYAGDSRRWEDKILESNALVPAVEISPFVKRGLIEAFALMAVPERDFKMLL